MLRWTSAAPLAAVLAAMNPVDELKFEVVRARAALVALRPP